ncbi:MAG: CBS domain-containing protein [Syntrophobacteraceae bacterium]|nr:CBS domain-containing protein [Syntrophobacteraceae bacterium]
MYVGWNMRTSLVTISSDTSIFRARELMEQHKISHLPVTDGKAQLLGIVTDRDLKEAWASPATTLSVHELTYVLQKLTVAHIMTKNVTTATPNMTIERAARIMHDAKIGALPVLRSDKLVGIITTTDLMEVLLMALGMSDDTKRLSVLVTDRAGVLVRIGEAMQSASVNILSTLTVPLRGHRDVWQVIVRFSLTDYKTAVHALEESGLKVLTDYIEDLTPYLPVRT